jgi:hypothetical protein
MAREPRVVIDTNVRVSFFLRRESIPWRVVVAIVSPTGYLQIVRGES